MIEKWAYVGFTQNFALAKGLAIFCTHVNSLACSGAY